MEELEEELEKDFFPSNKQKEKEKEKILDQDFEKAKEIKKTPVSIKKEKYSKKKPFLKLGIILLIFGIMCLVILEAGPWMYIKFDQSEEGNNQVELYYYKDFVLKGQEKNDTINNFFQSDYSGIYIGIKPADFSSLANKEKYIFYSMILLGFIFTIFAIFDKKRNLSIEVSTIVHTLFATITAGLCIYFIFLSVKFLAASILTGANHSFIEQMIPNATIVFLAPIIILFIVAGFLKVIFSVIKSNFKIFEKIQEEKKTKKPFYNYRYRGQAR